MTTNAAARAEAAPDTASRAPTQDAPDEPLDDAELPTESTPPGRAPSTGSQITFGCPGS